MYSKYLRWMVSGGLIAITLFTHKLTSYADQSFYIIDKSARPGMLVGLSKNPGVVELSTADRSSSLVGVLGGVSTGFDAAPGQVNVQTEGVKNVLVTTINGDIEVGDRITASSLVGLGGKLVENGWVVGVAQGSLDSKTSGAAKSVVRDISGVEHDVYVSSIPVLIKVTFYDATQTEDSSKSVIPKKLQQAIDNVTGRHASQLAVVLAFVVLLSGFIISGLIAYTAVRNAIKATGRQPLAKQAVTKRMLQACAISLITLVGAIVGALVVIRVL